MNYLELTTNIQDICENSFTADELAMFTQQAEQKIYNTVQIANLRKNVTGVLTANNKYLSAPGDFLSVYSLAVIKADGSYEFLLNKDVNFIRESFPDTDTAFYGEPQYYAVFDDNTFILGPTPDANYATELHYFYYPESIVTAGTSWLGTNFDSVLLYGALLEAANFMKSDADSVNLYKERYGRAMAELKQLGDAKERQDAYRSGQVRYPVK